MNTSICSMHTEKVGPPNIVLGGLVKYGTLIAGAYLVVNSLKEYLNQDSPGTVLKKAVKMLNNDTEAMKYLGEHIQPEVVDNKQIFQYPENGILKLDMTFIVAGNKDRGTYHVQARQNEKPKRFRFNWTYDSLNLHLNDGTVINIEINKVSNV